MLPLDGRSLMGHLQGTGGHDEVFGEYMAEGSKTPLVMIRRGPWKFIYSQDDICMLFNVQSDPDELRNLVLDLKRTLRIPVAMKLSPYFTALGNLAKRLDEAAVDGLVLFNRFYQPDIDLQTLTIAPRLELSTSSELRLRLQWTALLRGRVRTSLAVTGGVATPADGVKAVLAGADAVQLVSAVLQHGPAYFAVMREGLEQFMTQHEFDSVTRMKGLVSFKDTEDPATFQRANYIRTLQSWFAAQVS